MKVKVLKYLMLKELQYFTRTEYRIKEINNKLLIYVVLFLNIYRNQIQHFNVSK